MGAYQIAVVAMPYSSTNVIWEKGTWVHTGAALMPFVARIMVLRTRMISCIVKMVAKVTTGITTMGILNFASTVVRSETGSDFQNKMLRSRRSPCSASRQ